MNFLPGGYRCCFQGRASLHLIVLWCPAWVASRNAVVLQLTACHRQINFSALVSVRFGSSWRRSDSCALRMPITSRSCIISFFRLPNLQLSAIWCNRVINCSADSSHSWVAQLKLAIRKLYSSALGNIRPFVNYISSALKYSSNLLIT